ncbi:MAG: hypothetical protein WAL71_05840 [Terriglobales bacterium]|jgi:hypothetical protein
MSDDRLLAVLTDIRNWTRAVSYGSVKALLEDALPDSKSRSVYQMSDGAKTSEQIRVACKVSPNYVVSLTQKCVSMGIMEQKPDKKRVRLFDLSDFGLNPTANTSED